jgi:hypothetical protein
MLKTVSTWFRARVLHEDLVSQRADAATEQWDDVPLSASPAPAQPGPPALRRSTPPPIPPAKPRSHPTPAPVGAAEWREDLLALAKSTVSPTDPAEVPTPPPLTVPPPKAPRDLADVPTPPPLTVPPPKAPRDLADVPTPPPRTDEAEWAAAIARAKSGPIKVA